jgi:hypothetical protein
MVYDNSEENDTFTRSSDDSSADSGGLDLLSLMKDKSGGRECFGSSQSAGRDPASMLPSLSLDDLVLMPDGSTRPVRPEELSRPERLPRPEAQLAEQVLMMMRGNSSTEKISSALNSVFGANLERLDGDQVWSGIRRGLHPGETLQQLPDEGRASVYQLGDLTLRFHPARLGTFVEVTRTPAR